MNELLQIWLIPSDGFGIEGISANASKLSLLFFVA